MEGAQQGPSHSTVTTRETTSKESRRKVRYRSELFMGTTKIDDYRQGQLVTICGSMFERKRIDLSAK